MSPNIIDNEVPMKTLKAAKVEYLHSYAPQKLLALFLDSPILAIFLGMKSGRRPAVFIRNIQ